MNNPAFPNHDQRWTPNRAVIGMIHLHATPGSPRADLAPSELADRAANEANLLAELGFDAAIVENMHDAPYLRDGVGHETTAAVTAALLACQAAAPSLTMGVQILGGVGAEALAAANAADAAFIRVENFVFAHVADEGLMDRAHAGRLLRDRKRTDAERIAIFADIKKKHAAHAVTDDISAAQAAEAAAFFGADACIVTGSATGEPADYGDAQAARAAANLPVLVGSGVTDQTIRQWLDAADGAIVGSSIKRNGDWFNPIDPDRAKRLIDAAKA